MIYLRKMSSGYYDKCLSYVGTEIPILEAPTAQQTDRPFYATETTPYNAETQLNLHARLTRDWNDEFQVPISLIFVDFVDHMFIEFSNKHLRSITNVISNSIDID